MNFLSHYFINDERDEADYSLGKVLPDLSRNFHPEFRVLQPGKTGLANDLEPLENFIEGIRMHFITDKLFHASGYFKKKTGLLTEILKSLHLETIRRFYFFYSHILLEIMLDRMLVKQFPEKVMQFYSLISKVQNETIREYMEYNGSSKFYQGFIEFLQHFIDVKYIYQYASNERIIFALGRIVSRTGLPEFSEADRIKLIDTVSRFESVMENDYLSIFAKIKKSIP